MLCIKFDRKFGMINEVKNFCILQKYCDILQ